ncbi:hypothetical protein CKO35_06315 [Ectothiorhodospira shaposhnikovii]|uniref:hypothetical protein n=1 Tax=Ectothiorhodospira shaposhnikovii TaxID=1054 RepID=UPI001903748B|nr:hypothetical protein [Ectothiorhodospira shaposhnikovii]MBK1672924.1 hypothetical protein [Ectothiorhodospira shaposhnikovii]
MPYQGGKRLSGEKASKLGHLDVVNSALVNELIEQFEDQEPAQVESLANWEAIPNGETPLRLIFAVDGSKQTIRSDFPPYKELSFIKTALLRLDQHAIEKLDPVAPHPMALRDIMSDSAMYHATVLPLKGLSINGQSNYDAVRRIIFDSLQDQSLNAEPYKTLKWLAYEKWSGQQKSSPSFGCPHCEKDIGGLSFDQDEGACEHCGGHLYLTDMIGFHLEMSEDAAPESVATAYMLIHETLLLFTGIRFFWEAKKYSVLSNALFIKDGPLFLKGQYSKLVIPIRNFFDFAKQKGISVHVVGQEKTGAFFDHLEIIARNAPNNSLFAPSNEYIRKEIQHRPERAEPYGSRTNYGNKLFVKFDEYHHLVLSIPTGHYTDTDSLDVFLSLNRILVSLPPILSHRHECALVPVELANGVASLSSYPSAAILKVFADI